MDIKIFPSRISGTISAPPSKSFSHRAIFMASLASDVSIIKGISVSDDVNTTIAACRSLGANIQELDTGILQIAGIKGKISADLEIDCRESGTTLRFLLAIAAITRGTITIKGSSRLSQRPIKPLIDSLMNLGVEIEFLEKDGSLPVKITGNPHADCTHLQVDSSQSSQFASALLLITPLLPQPVSLEVQGNASKPYIAVTEACMKTFGQNITKKGNVYTIIPHSYEACHYTVEGDYSGASYLFAAAAMTGGNICVGNLNPKSAQGDKAILTILQEMGSTIEELPQGISLTGPVTHPIHIDMQDIPDLVQTIVACTSIIPATSTIINIGHLVHKESNRIVDTCANLSLFSIQNHCTTDTITIHGTSNIHGDITIPTYNDHRMAMSMTLLALMAKKPVIIKNAEVVNKSYPAFWHDMQKIGLQMEQV